MHPPLTPHPLLTPLTPTPHPSPLTLPHPHSVRDGDRIHPGDAAATLSDPNFTRAFLGGHLQPVLFPQDGMEVCGDAMSGWRTNIREGARIDVIFAEDNHLPPGKPQSHWLGFQVNGGPLRHAGTLLAGFRVRPWVYMAGWNKREQHTSSPYLVEDTMNASRRPWMLRAHPLSEVESEDELESESQGESEGESEGEAEGESEGESEGE